MQFGDILKNPESEGKEKHVPIIEIIKDHGPDKVNIVHVVVGKEVAHPNTVEHHIAWIEVYGIKPEGQVINLGRSSFAPGYTRPTISLSVPVEQFKSFCAVSYCNLHGVWQSCLDG